MHQTKIATCSYCGRRQTLRPLAREGHELACSACGAPLHEMKWLKAPEAEATNSGNKSRKRSAKRRPPHPAPVPGGAWGEGRLPEWQGVARRRKKSRKRKSLWGEIFEEAFDVIEDIFD
jgi:hypothetical protein